MITTNIQNSTVSTAVAATLLNRKPRTLHKWACLENGPLRPIRINGRLAWPLDAIQALLNPFAERFSVEVC